MHIRALTAQRKPKLTYDHLRRARLPRRAWDFRLEQINNPVISVFCQGIYDHLKGGRGLRLYGPEGAGKTTAACVVAKYAMLHQATVLYLPGADFMRASIRDEMFDAELEETVIERAEAVNLLIFDNPSMIGNSEHAWTRLRGLLKKRSDDMLSTILVADDGVDDVSKFDYRGSSLSQDVLVRFSKLLLADGNQ